MAVSSILRGTDGDDASPVSAEEVVFVSVAMLARHHLDGRYLDIPDLIVWYNHNVTIPGRR